jgi:hypothetical protein
MHDYPPAWLIQSKRTIRMCIVLQSLFSFCFNSLLFPAGLNLNHDTHVCTLIYTLVIILLWKKAQKKVLKNKTFCRALGLFVASWFNINLLLGNNENKWVLRRTLEWNPHSASLTETNLPCFLYSQSKKMSNKNCLKNIAPTFWKGLFLIWK